MVDSIDSFPAPRTILSLAGLRVLPLVGTEPCWLIRIKIWAEAALPAWLALAGVAASIWLSFRFGQSFAFTGFLQLVLVVLAARYGGFWQATLVSVAAAACLNYFFVPPIFSFVNSPANWVALGAFEFTALIISRLSLSANQRALEAIAGRRDTERLYETSRRILLLDSRSEPGDLIASLIGEMFDLKGVRLFDAQSGAAYQKGETPIEADRKTQNAYFQDTDTYDTEAMSWYCVLRQGNRPVGGLALNGAEMNHLAATALASLCGIALERARSRHTEARAEAARETEQLRTAVLDALAHQFKTPLAVTRTASSGLLAVGGLSELQTDLVTTIDKQATLLDHLTARLLKTAMLDSTDFIPQREPLLFSRITGDAIEKLEYKADRQRFNVSVPSSEIRISADRKLVLTSLAQLLDNAIKYSEPCSVIAITFAVSQSAVVLRLRSKGLVVATHDRERVFERFYRAAATHHLPAGTGLGLSIVKKIVEAHRGGVSGEGEPGFGTSFFVALPTARIC